MSVPVTVRIAEGGGSYLEEKTYTGVVGAVGAMVRLSRDLELGAELELTNSFSQRTARFR